MSVTDASPPPTVLAPVRSSPSTGLVVALAFSPDGTRLASLEQDGRLRVLDVASGRLVASAPGAGAIPWTDGISFTADGADVLCRPGPGAIARARGARLRPMVPIPPPTGEIRGVRGSPGGPEVIAWGPAGAFIARLDGGPPAWEVMTSRPVADACFSEDGAELGIADEDGGLLLRPRTTGPGGSATRLDAPAATLRPAGRAWLAAQVDGRLAWLRPAAPPHVWYAGHDALEGAVGFPGGGTAISFGEGPTARVWRLRQGGGVEGGAFTPPSRTGTAGAACAAASPDGFLVALGGARRIWWLSAMPAAEALSGWIEAQVLG